MVPSMHTRMPPPYASICPYTEEAQSTTPCRKQVLSHSDAQHSAYMDHVQNALRTAVVCVQFISFIHFTGVPALFARYLLGVPES